jgi:hypothetical protein
MITRSIIVIAAILPITAPATTGVDGPLLLFSASAFALGVLADELDSVFLFPGPPMNPGTCVGSTGSGIDDTPGFPSEAEVARVVGVLGIGVA